MKIFLHLFVLSCLIVPLVYINHINPIVNETVTPKETVQSVHPQYLKYFPIDGIKNGDLKQYLQDIEKLEMSLQNQTDVNTDLLKKVSDYKQQIINAESVNNGRSVLVNVQNLIVNFDQWQKAKNLKAIDHYLLQIKNLIPLLGKSIFYQENNYLKQISNLIQDIKNSSFSNPNISRQDKDRILKLLDPISDNLYSLERLVKLSNQIIVSKVAINKAAADLQTTLLSQVVVTPTKISREPQSIVQTPRAKIVITFYLGLVILSYLSWWLLGNRKEKVKIVKRPMTEKAIIPRFDAQLPVALVSNKVVNDSQFDLHSVVRKVLNEIIENSIDQGVLLTLSGTGPLMIKGDRQKAVVETQNILTSVISNVSRYSIHKKVKIILKQEVGEIIFEIRYSPNDPEVFFEAIKDSIQCKPHFGKMTSKKLYDENGLLLFTGVNVRAPISSPRLAM